MADKACHAIASTTQVGLTQALGGFRYVSVVERFVARLAAIWMAVNRRVQRVAALCTASAMAAPFAVVAVINLVLACEDVHSAITHFPFFLFHCPLLRLVRHLTSHSTGTAFAARLIPALGLMKRILILSFALVMLLPFGALGAGRVCPVSVFPPVPSAGYKPSRLVRLVNPPAEATDLRELLGQDEFPAPVQAWFRTRSGLLVLYQGYRPDGGHLTGFFKTRSGWRKMDVGEQVDCRPEA